MKRHRNLRTLNCTSECHPHLWTFGLQPPYKNTIKLLWMCCFLCCFLFFYLGINMRKELLYCASDRDTYNTIWGLGEFVQNVKIHFITKALSPASQTHHIDLRWVTCGVDMYCDEPLKKLQLCSSPIGCSTYCKWYTVYKTLFHCPYSPHIHLIVTMEGGTSRSPWLELPHCTF
jgi:hypothetical protein